MQSLLFSVLAHHKPTVYSAFHRPVYPTRSEGTAAHSCTPTPPFLLLPSLFLLSQIWPSQSDACATTWLGSDRRRGHSLQTERDVNVLLTGTVQSQWMHACVFPVSSKHTLIRNQSEKRKSKLHFFCAFQSRQLNKTGGIYSVKGPSGGRGMIRARLP